MKTHLKHKLISLFILALVCLLVLPITAQDVTAEATPSATVEAAPVTIVNGEGEGTTINVNAPAETPQSPESSSPNILNLTLGELLGILFGGGALAVGIGKILWDGNQPGQPSLDERLTTQVNTAHSDREWLEKLERAYALGESKSKTAIDALAGVLKTIAPLTPLRVDDAALALLTDIQKEGTVPPADKDLDWKTQG